MLYVKMHRAYGTQKQGIIVVRRIKIRRYKIDRAYGTLKRKMPTHFFLKTNKSHYSVVRFISF